MAWGERLFLQHLCTHLRREPNPQHREQIKAIRITRSHSGPLIQLADYVAGLRIAYGREGLERNCTNRTCGEGGEAKGNGRKDDARCLSGATGTHASTGDSSASGPISLMVG